MKAFKDFKYYPVVMCHGKKGEKKTIVNINVGGQVFRFYDEKFRSGLLG